MNRIATAVVALLSTCFISPAVSASEVTIAPIAHSADGRPIWVSAQTAFTPSGDLRADLFSASARSRIDMLRSMNGDECLHFALFPPLEIYASADSLDELAANSTAIIAGDVVATEKGFYRERPGTLFTIRVSHRLKVDDRDSRSVALLFIGEGRIDTPRGAICAMVPRNSVIPKVDDRIVFFAYQPPLDVENHIFLVEPHRHLVAQSGQTLRSPKALTNGDEPTNMEEVLRRVARSVGSGQTARPVQ